MSKYIIQNTYCCRACGKEFDKDLDAIDCFDSHDKPEKINNYYYLKGQIYPNQIVIKTNKDRFISYYLSCDGEVEIEKCKKGNLNLVSNSEI